VRAVGVPQTVRRETLRDRHPAGFGPSGSVATTGRDAGPRVGEHRDRADGVRRFARVSAGDRWLEQPGREAVPAPVRGELARGRASHVVQFGDRRLYLDPGYWPDRVGLVQHR